MTDMANDQEKRVKQLKRNLEGWREVVLPVNSILTWEQQWYAGVTAGVITFAFLSVWWFDPSVLTLISILGLIAVLVDYLVPTLASSFCRADSWTGVKEKRLEEICRSLAKTESCLLSTWSNITAWRNARPKLYYLFVVGSLLSFAYIGSKINNMLLTYFIVMIVAMAPGLRKCEIVEQQLKKILTSIGGMIGYPASAANNENNGKKKEN